MGVVLSASTLTKTTPLWEAAESVYEYDDGWKILAVTTQKDLSTLGNLMGHCAGHHFGWVQDKVFYLFTLVDKQGNPRGTILAKTASWINKIHPNDKLTGFDYAGADRRTYASTTYDHFATRDDRQNQAFKRMYHCSFPTNKPASITPNTWNAFLQAFKAVQDEHLKTIGDIRLVGRRIKWDGRYVIVLEASGGGQGDITKYRQRIGEWLNSLGKKKGA